MAQNSDAKPFWHYVNSSRKNRSRIGPLLQGKSVTSTDEECAQTLSDFYATVYTVEDSVNIPFAIPKTTDELVSVSFSPGILLLVLSKTNSFSSAGPDQLPYCVLKNGGYPLLSQLSRLFQLCIDIGSLPKQWKIAHVTPIFKKGNRKDPANYRPISLTSSICKLMESCLRQAMWKFWSEQNLILTTQFGFSPSSSCVDQLLLFIEKVTTYIDDGFCVDAVYLDFSKAFNSVPHLRLLNKLSALGIKGNLYNWIKSFLTDRTEIVVVNGKHSLPQRMLSGVPQGSCLGPLLFIAYVNDIDSIISTGCSILKYADDMKIYRGFSHHNALSESVLLQQDLNQLSKWSKLWKLNFNVPKCSSLHFGSQNAQYHYILDDLPIAQKKNEKDLGVHVSDNLKFSFHISNVVKKAECLMGVPKKFIVSRDQVVFIRLYKQLIRPHLEYATCVWNPHFKRDIRMLEQVQRRATKCVHGLHHIPYEERLKILNLDSLYHRRLVNDLVCVYRLSHGKHSSSLSFEDFFVSNNNTTRGHSFKLQKPMAKLNCRKFSFAHRIVTLWNSLPANIVNCKSVKKFKTLASDFVTSKVDMDV